MLSRVYDWLYRIVKWLRIPVHWVFGTHDELTELIDSGRIKPGRAIDLGCGAGREVILLAQRGFTATGVDISPTAIAMARRSSEDAGVKAQFLVGDLTALPPIDGTYDLIVDYGALNDLNQTQRDAYMTQVLPLASPTSQFVLMCFDNKLPRSEIEQRFGASYDIDHVSSKGEPGRRRTISFYLMEHRADPGE